MFAQKNNIAIRALEPDDASLIYKWENDKSAWAHSDNLLPYSYFQIEQFILEGHDIYRNRQARFMVMFKDNSIFHTVGMIDLYDFHPHHRRAGVGIYIDLAYRRKGIGIGALELLTDYAFEVLGMHQLYCVILPDNLPSLKLFERLGFTVAGHQKEWFYENGKFHDQIMMQLINPKRPTQ